MSGDRVCGVRSLQTIGDIVGAARAILERRGITAQERQLAGTSFGADAARALRAEVSSGVRRGEDPLGDAFCVARSAEDRRPLGQTYTPAPVIAAMAGWAAEHGTPQRIVDPGAGSGRYVLAAARRFQEAHIVAADIDPVATLMLRANVSAAGLTNRVKVVQGDYRALRLPRIKGSTLFIGNPPYVRHHQIDPEWKRWLLDTASARGLVASGLAGLHVHFFLATAQHARPGDYGTFITSAEWLDVNYGRLARNLFTGSLGLQSLHVLEPEAQVFADAATTASIACFTVGEQPASVRVRRVESVGELGRLGKGRDVARARLVETNRWSALTRATPKLPEGYIELGELCRVHRGTVTGANDVWVARGAVDLPDRVLYRSVTKARDLFAAGDRLTSNAELRRVIDLPADLSIFEDEDRHRIEQFLRAAKSRKADQGYVARNRRAWWSVGLREPAPVLATYMARRPPAFVRNDTAARHINIAHGLYPRQPLPDAVLDALAQHLRGAVSLAQGRTYAGGLTKFEPKEMERLPIPSLEALSIGA